MTAVKPKWWQDRNNQLDLLGKTSFDILVIGGGASGAGIALDASSRGLKTALIEAKDFSYGTSSRSTKLVHGGVRYLENAIKNLNIDEYSLVRDALLERKNFLNNASHLTRKLAMITPVYNWIEASYYLMGLKIYDLLSGKSSLGGSKFLSRKETINQFPMLKKHQLKGSVLFYDGQFDDARMNISLIISAIKEGAVTLNYAPFINFIKKNDIISGAQIIDTTTQKIIEIFAKVVINATGSFADKIRRIDDDNSSNILTLSQGSHIVLDTQFSPKNLGMVIPKTKDGRVLFVLPWLNKTIVGTTDLPVSYQENPEISAEEIIYIINHLNEYYETKITSKHVLASFSGIRPLMKVHAKKSNTASLSRDHFIEISSSGLITIIGGKWTTYRLMAKDVVDKAISHGLLLAKNESKTNNLKLVGSTDDIDLDKNLMHLYNIDNDIALHLSCAYGEQAHVILQLDNNIIRLLKNYPFIEQEIIYAVRYEYALHPIDFLARRTRLAFLDNNAAMMALPKVVEIMSSLLNWSYKQKEQEYQESISMLKNFSISSIKM